MGFQIKLVLEWIIDRETHVWLYLVYLEIMNLWSKVDLDFGSTTQLRDSSSV